jgi:ketosteroid isomerase-like protein
MKYLHIIGAFIFLAACNNKTTDDYNSSDKAAQEIRKAEADFAEMAKNKGIAEAFSFFADSNAVIRRGNDSLIHGIEGVRNFYNAPHYKTAEVSWAPDFADASSDGTMGYTYGKYHWDFKDSTGKITSFNGIFHTVWKKQKDGSWKYVWD